MTRSEEILWRLRNPPLDLGSYERHIMTGAADHIEDLDIANFKLERELAEARSVVGDLANNLDSVCKALTAARSEIDQLKLKNTLGI